MDTQFQTHQLTFNCKTLWSHQTNENHPTFSKQYTSHSIGKLLWTIHITLTFWLNIQKSQIAKILTHRRQWVDVYSSTLPLAVHYNHITCKVFRSYPASLSSMNIWMACSRTVENRTCGIQTLLYEREQNVFEMHLQGRLCKQFITE